ncbi:site-specific recombinase, DNA invertase Pin [Rivularia sp. PCC 7116]|uniref:fdxN element excision recombinase XisF n=1 Tax=Rivularia sp. PCC 7116 TaxID=373994 RepID=UPI00029ECC4F|nr:fdxN element excision recombinase XisF [Rivularia sp. PCC 7116]AFY58653.1 site-specific recombinase, DNA invertase Pin [Rivularia sp. PCC 7116]
MIYGYARVSTVEQSLEYDALKQQVKRLEDAGADVVLVDIESGRSNKRKEFNKLLKMVERGKIREIIVTRIDRLGRSDIDVIRTIQLFNDSGIILRILDAPIDVSSSFGRFSASQMAALADFESRLLSERTRHGMAYFRSQGKVQSACFGYRLNEEHKIIPHEKNFPIARKVIELLLEDYSFGAVSKYLFEEHGINYSVSGIRHWLENPTLLGHTRYFTDMEQKRNPKNPRPPQIIKNTHEAIATEFEIARIKRNAKSRPRFTGKKEKEYPLKGLLKCADCKGGMFRIISRYKSGETHWIRCNKHARNPHLCHNKKNSRLNVLTKQVIKAITDEAEKIIEQSELADSPVESSELIDLKQQLEGLKALNSSNPAIIAAMQDIENQIEAEVMRSQYADKIDADRLKLAWSYSQPAFWESLDNDDLRQAFKSFVEAVFVDSTGNVSSISFDE